MRVPVYGYIPQCVPHHERLPRRGPLIVWSAVAAVALAWMCVTALAPLALARGHAFLAQVIYQGFSVACHQMPERSFHLDGHPLAVCARCFGIYAGFAACALLYPLVRPLQQMDVPSRWWLLIAAVPVALDFALGLSGLRENTHLSRAATGALLGAVAPLYVIPGLISLGRAKNLSVFLSNGETIDE